MALNTFGYGLGLTYLAEFLLAAIAVFTVYVFREHQKSRRALADIRKHEKDLKAAQRLAHVGSWSWDIRGKSLTWSDEVYRIFGLTPQEFGATYEAFLGYVHPEDRQLVQDTVNKCLESGEHYEVEHRLVREDGVNRYVVECGEVEFGADDEPTFMRGTVHDISARRAAEEEVQRLNRDLERRVQERTAELNAQKKFSDQLVDTAGVIILVLDTDGRIVRFNPFLEALFGHTLEDARGADWAELAAPEADFAIPADAVQSVGRLIPIRSKDGDLLQIEWYGSPLSDGDGAVKGSLWVGLDISERLELQVQLVQSSKLATLGEMATGVAHELNQPLGIIRFAVRNLSRKLPKDIADQPDIREKLSRIGDQTRRASDIIDHMRIFGRRSEHAPGPVSLPQSAESALRLIGEQLRLADIAVELDFGDDCPLAMGHQVQVEQVFLNLFANARDAILRTGGASGGRIQVSSDCPPGCDLVRISVRDTGGGIPEQVVDRIFEPFFTTKEVGKGTGLGLSISYGIVTDMGGTIAVENVDGGAEFTISVPATTEISMTA